VFEELAMRHIVFLVLVAPMLFVTGHLLAGDNPAAEAEVVTLKREYADVLALQGVSKREILAIARILRANPAIAVDRTAEGGEYCFKSSPGAMVHFTVHPERTAEDVVYEFDASGLIAAGMDPTRLQQLPELGRMTPGIWYFLAKGQIDPHHGHEMAGPVIAIAFDVE
jgi:hypothetical protein